MRRLLYLRGWDTSTRNRAAADILGPAIGELSRYGERPLLDVGCGGAGVASFLDGVQIVGVDVDEPLSTPPNLTFERGSTSNLPFPDRAFAFVSCVDVIENLPAALRPQAIGELVRVAARGVLLACPHGENAARCDAEFRHQLDRRGRPAPPWLIEHETHPYPTVEELVESVRDADAGATISVSYSEPMRICRLVRSAATRSSVLYAATDLLFGFLAPLIPSPGRENAYRVSVFVRRSA